MVERVRKPNSILHKVHHAILETLHISISRDTRLVQLVETNVIAPPIHRDALPTEFLKCRYLQGIQLSENYSESSDDGIDILIGADYYWDFVTGRVKRQKNLPVAIESILGWILQGKVEPELCCPSTITSLCSISTTERNEVNKELKKSSEIEEMGKNKDIMLSKEDIKVPEKYEETITHENDGKYQVRFPDNEELSEMGATEDKHHNSTEDLSITNIMQKKVKSKYPKVPVTTNSDKSSVRQATTSLKESKEYCKPQYWIMSKLKTLLTIIFLITLFLSDNRIENRISRPLVAEGLQEAEMKWIQFRQQGLLTEYRVLEKHNLHCKYILEYSPWWGEPYKNLMHTIQSPQMKILNRSHMNADETYTSLDKVNIQVSSRLLSSPKDEQSEQNYLKHQHPCSLQITNRIQTMSEWWGVSRILYESCVFCDTLYNPCCKYEKHPVFIKNSVSCEVIL